MSMKTTGLLLRKTSMLSLTFREKTNTRKNSCRKLGMTLKEVTKTTCSKRYAMTSKCEKQKIKIKYIGKQQPKKLTNDFATFNLYDLNLH